MEKKKRELPGLTIIEDTANYEKNDRLWESDK